MGTEFSPQDRLELLRRWRLILGAAAEEPLRECASACAAAGRAGDGESLSGGSAQAGQGRQGGSPSGNAAQEGQSRQGGSVSGGSGLVAEGVTGAPSFAGTVPAGQGGSSAQSAQAGRTGLAGGLPGGFGRSPLDQSGEPESGNGASGSPDGAGATLLDREDQQRDRLLEQLYGREHEGRDYQPGMQQRHRHQPRQGGSGSSTGFSVPEWLSGVRELFPQSTAETLQHHALERYGLRELLTDPQVLRQAPADIEMVRALIEHRSLLSREAMGEARRLIRKVVAELEERLARRVRNKLLGPRLRQEHGGRRTLANLDWATTLRRNLRNYQPELDVVIPERLWFWKRQRRGVTWDLILLVDQSASMLDSVIHSAVLAAIFHGLRTLRTRMVLFDTRVVDVTEQIGDPVELLLGVQLGGGTDIGAALDYARSRVESPRRTMVVVISDFYEGGDPRLLLQLARRLHQSGVTLLGLAALDDRAMPDYDQIMGRQLSAAGMQIGAMTPDRLADWVGDVLGRG